MACPALLASKQANATEGRRLLGERGGTASSSDPGETSGRPRFGLYRGSAPRLETNRASQGERWRCRWPPMRRAGHTHRSRRRPMGPTIRVAGGGRQWCVNASICSTERSQKPTEKAKAPRRAIAVPPRWLPRQLARPIGSMAELKSLKEGLTKWAL
eukprot:1097493-Amphidinium_carterae.4